MLQYSVIWFALVSSLGEWCPCSSVFVFFLLPSSSPQMTLSQITLFPCRGNIIKISFKRKRFFMHLKRKHVSTLLLVIVSYPQVWCRHCVSLKGNSTQVNKFLCNIRFNLTHDVCCVCPRAFWHQFQTTAVGGVAWNASLLGMLKKNKINSGLIGLILSPPMGYSSEYRFNYCDRTIHITCVTTIIATYC